MNSKNNKSSSDQRISSGATPSAKSSGNEDNGESRTANNGNLPVWRWCVQCLTTVVKCLGWLVLLAFASTFLARWSFEAELLGNFRLQMALLTLAWCLIAFVLGQAKLGWMLVVATLWNVILVGWSFWPADQPLAGPQKFRIMSYNLFAAAEDIGVVLSRIETEDPDVLVLIEFDHQWYDGLSSLKENYPHQVLAPRWHGFGIAIFSRLPLRKGQVHQLINHVTDTPLPVADVVVGEQVIRVFGVHTISPTNRQRLSYRNQQLREIAAYVKTSDVPAVAIGDFNSTAWSPFVLDFLAETGLRDSSQGYGYQPTWHREYWPIRIPIDNAFVSPKIHVHQREVGQGSASDHFPIVLEISISDS